MGRHRYMHTITSNKNYQFLSGNILKMIAIVTMFIDHFAKTIFTLLLTTNYHTHFLSLNSEHIVGILATLFEQIGRIAFPLFCFLLVEGYIYTSNRKKYALRLFIFAFISELPFDLTFWSNLSIIFGTWPFCWSYQNVFFTLFLGLVSMWCIDFFHSYTFVKRVKLNKFSIITLQIMSTLLIGSLAWYIGSDYEAFGIWLIASLYYFRKNKLYQIIAGLLTSIVLSAFKPLYLISFLLMLLYSGKRGKIQLKYFFYAFYPLHMVLLYVAMLILSYYLKIPYNQIP